MRRTTWMLHRPVLENGGGHAMRSASFLCRTCRGLLITILLLSIMVMSNAPVQAASITQQQTVQRTNQERKTADLTDLIVDERLSQSAQQKAEHMLEHNYWNHNAPDGTTPWVFIEQAGIEYEAAGENLARGFYSVESMVEAWMGSPMHRANILNKSFTHVGIGTATGTLEGVETTVVVAHYAWPTDSANVQGASSLVNEAKIDSHVIESIGRRLYLNWERLLQRVHIAIQPAQKLLT